MLEWERRDKEARAVGEKIQREPFDESEYPPGFLKIVQRSEESLQKDGGVALIGRVRYKDGSPVGIDALTFSLRAAPPYGESHNCYQYYDRQDAGPAAWFFSSNVAPGPINKRILDAAEADGQPRGLMLSVLSMDSLPTPPAIFRITQGQIIYLDVELEKVPPEKRIAISGTVKDETGKPAVDAFVGLRIAESTGSGGRDPRKETKTDAEGRYSFESLVPQAYSVYAFRPGWEGDGTLVPAPKEESERKISVPELVLFKPKKIVFDFVFQPDGSRDFTKGELTVQTLEMEPHRGGISFKEGAINRDGRDLELFSRRGKLSFGNVYITSGNGVYDAGEVAFESIVEAREGNEHYRPDGQARPVPVEVNHVYVVRTYEGQYAKLIVHEILTIEPANESLK